MTFSKLLLFVAAGIFVSEADTILKLKLPKESFKESFFKIKDINNYSESSDSHNEKDEMMGNPLSQEDFDAGEQISEKDFEPPPGDDPIQSAGFFEGDIKDPKLIESDKEKTDVHFLNAIQDGDKKWRGGEIPYLISRSFDAKERGIVARAIKEYHKRTCIRFRPREKERDYVFFTKKQGCYSVIGKSRGPQDLSLGIGCMYVGIVIHELMHAVGFWHEQSRSDRDDFIHILWGNIQDGQTFNFAKYTDGRHHHQGLPYDYGSVMHYGAEEFSKFRNRPTIITKQRNIKIGQRKGFSRGDIQKINKLYDCDARRGNEQPRGKPQQPRKQPQPPQQPRKQPQPPQQPRKQPQPPQQPRKQPQPPQQPRKQPQLPQQPKKQPQLPQQPKKQPQAPQQPWWKQTARGPYIPPKEGGEGNKRIFYGRLSQRSPELFMAGRFY